MAGELGDEVVAFCLGPESFDALRGRAADLCMPVADYAGMCLEFCDELPLALLAAYRDGGVRLHFSEEGLGDAG